MLFLCKRFSFILAIATAGEENLEMKEAFE